MNINGIGHAVPKTYEEIGTLVARSRSQDTAALIAGDVISVLAKAVEPMTTQESEDFISELGLLSILVARESLLMAEGRKGIGMESNLVDFASIASGLTESQVYATLARLKKDTTEVMEFGTPSLIAILTVPFFLGNAHSAIASLEEKATRHGLSSDAP